MHSHTNERMKLLKRLAFGLLGAVMAVLVTATVLEKIYGTDFAAAHIYGAGWFAALWGALTLAALACLFLAAFLYEAALSEPKYFVPARVLTGFGAICFTLYSIVSILESGASKK